MTEDLASSAEEQSAATEEMATGMGYASSAVDEIKEKVLKINKLVEDQKTSSSEVSSSSGVLLQTSELLQTEINRFKL